MHTPSLHQASLPLIVPSILYPSSSLDWGCSSNQHHQLSQSSRCHESHYPNVPLTKKVFWVPKAWRTAHYNKLHSLSCSSTPLQHRRSSLQSSSSWTCYTSSKTIRQMVLSIRGIPNVRQNIETSTLSLPLLTLVKLYFKTEVAASCFEKILLKLFAPGFSFSRSCQKLPKQWTMTVGLND